MAIIFHFGKMPLRLSRVRACPHCGGDRVKRSQRASFRVSLLKLFGISSFRCLDCWQRYLGWRGARLSVNAVEAVNDSFMNAAEEPPMAFGKSGGLGAGKAQALSSTLWILQSNTVGAALAETTQAGDNSNSTPKNIPTKTQFCPQLPQIDSTRPSEWNRR
jgi:hypothetical protein